MNSASLFSFINLHIRHFCNCDYKVGLTSILLLTLLLWLAITSLGFQIQLPWLERPTFQAVSLSVLAGITFLLLCYLVLHKQFTISLTFIFVLGLILRLIFLPSLPINEDDYYRYFFDGSLINQGLNPYQLAPAEASPKVVLELIDGQVVKTTQAPHADLAYLANEPWVKHIPYADIHTVYPPVALAFFSLSEAINSASLLTWRLILLCVELLSFVFIAKVLKKLNRPKAWIMLYWLNPLVITETINAGHMDSLLILPLIATFYFAVSQRFMRSGLVLAIAAGLKVWPILLLPLVLRPLFLHPRKLIYVGSISVLVTTILLAPQWLNFLSPQDGLTVYAQYWRTNSFIYGLIEDGFLLWQNTQSFYLGVPQLSARFVVLGLFTCVVALLVKKIWQNEHDLSHALLMCVAWLFLLSPTGYPWYFIWLVPFLIFSPSWPLLLFAALLPLYDLRYPFEALGKTELFNTYIVPMQFLPVLIWLVVNNTRKDDSLN